MATKVKSAPTSPATSAAAMLAKLAAKAKPKASSKPAKPEINEPSLEEAINKLVEAHKEAQKWNGIIATHEAQVSAFVAPARLEVCRRLGRVESTIRVNDKINFQSKNAYSKIPIAHAEELREAFGTDTDAYFVQKTQLALTDAAVEDEELLTELIEALGPERFEKAFVANQYLKVTEAFHADFTLKPQVEEKARPFLEAEIIKPFKPSLKP